MRKAAILPHLQSLKTQRQKGLTVLMDPDKTSIELGILLAQRAAAAGVDFLLVGGSLIQDDAINHLIPALKAHTDLEVVIFPGSISQIVPSADGMLFLSLISGRNPDYLIGRQVEAAPLLRQTELEILPTGYMLIEAGNMTTVRYISNTLPIPRQKPDVAMCTALAGEMLGLRLIYMDGGSGAQWPVPSDMIELVASQLHIPLMVGGGIRSVEEASRIWQAGADMIVVGTAIEDDPEAELLFALGREKEAINRLLSPNQL